jgi:hypothetical protein
LAVAAATALGALLMTAAPARAASYARADANLNPSLVLGGTAVSSADGTITLTTDGQSQSVGTAWTPNKMEVLTGFLATFAFRISPDRPEGSGSDGFAFVVQNDPMRTAAMGQPGQDLGFGTNVCPSPALPGISHSVAVEFDTYQNAGFCGPKSVGDPNGNHVSVQTRNRGQNTTNDYYSLGDTTQVPNMHDGTRHDVRISYLAGTLTVDFDGQQVLSVPMQLSNIGLGESGRAYVGFTGATGGGSETAQILHFSFEPTTSAGALSTT